MSNTAPNDEELTPAGLRRNRLTLAYRDGQREGVGFRKLLDDPDPRIPSVGWAAQLAAMKAPPRTLRGEDREAWEAGFMDGRNAGPDGELSPSPYLETRGAAR